MKRILLAAAALFIFIAADAQNVAAVVEYNHLDMKEFYNGNKIDNGYTGHLNGFAAGFDFEVPTYSIVSFYPGIRFKSSFDRYSVPSSDYKAQVSSISASVPLNAKASMWIGRAKCFIFVGPELEFGFTMRVKEGPSVINYYKNGTLRRFNVLANAGIGADLGSIRIKGSYGHTLVNGFRSPVKGDKLRTSVISVGISYIFF